METILIAAERIAENISIRLKKFGLKRALCCAIAAAVLVALIVTGFALDHHYRDKAVPGTKLAGVSVAGMTKQDITSKAKALYKEIAVQFEGVGNGEPVVAADLGISLDAERTANEIISSGNAENIFVRFFPYKKKESSLILSYDADVMREYLRETFPDMMTEAVNAAVSYNAETGVFDVVPGRPGKNIEIPEFDRILRDAASRPGLKTVGFTAEDVPPPVDDAAAAQARDFANARLDIALNLVYNGQTVYTVERGDIAGWFDFSCDENAGEVAVTINEERVRRYVIDTAAPQIVRGKVDRRVILDGAGNEIFVIRQGQTGRTIGNSDPVVEGLIAAVTNATDLDREIELAEEPFATIVDHEAHWVDVNLSNQTTIETLNKLHKKHGALKP
jgi:hypothetical protein